MRLKLNLSLPQHQQGVLLTMNFPKIVEYELISPDFSLCTEPDNRLGGGMEPGPTAPVVEVAPFNLYYTNQDHGSQ